jgi:hypothetical protein
MDRLRRELMLALAGAFGSGIVPHRVFACAFDGLFDGSLGYVHPRSVEVALAVRKAVVDGLLAEQALAPVIPGAAGLWRATEQLNQLGRRLSAMSAEAPRDIPCIAALLSESALWARYVGYPQGFVTLIHAAGPQPADVVIVSDLAVLTALNGGSLGVADALERTLIVIDTTGPKADAVATLLTAALDQVAVSTTSDLQDRTAWRGSKL